MDLSRPRVAFLFFSLFSVFFFVLFLVQNRPSRIDSVSSSDLLFRRSLRSSPLPNYQHYLSPCTHRHTSFKVTGKFNYGAVVGLRISPSAPPHVWAPAGFIDPYRKDILSTGITTISKEEFPVRMMQMLPVSGVYFDVGANVGVNSLPVAAMALNHSVFAFEPVPKMVDLLCMSKNLGDWQYEHLRVVEAAVSNSEAKTTSLFVPNRKDNTAFTKEAALANVDEGSIISEIVVATIKLDDFIAEEEIQRVDLLKIDVQGHELQVLQGAKQSLTKHIIKALHVENDIKITRKAGIKTRDIFVLLSNAGYLAYAESEASFVVDKQTNSFVASSTAKPLTEQEYVCGKLGECTTYDVLWLPK